jgi:hypothetical protein
MMKKASLILLATALTMATGVSCGKMEKGKTDVTQSEVVISFSSAAPVTRAGAVGDGVVADGGGIFINGSDPDLYIAIANYQGDVIATYTGTDTADAERVGDATATQVSIRFKTISNPGEYTVYALANTYVDGTDGVWGAPANASEWEALTTATALDNLKFSDLGDYGTLAVTDRMPLSAKGTLSISENLNGHVELEMLRCVGKVGFKFKNESDESITLTGCTVEIEEISPSQGYLFPRTSGDDTAGTPRSISLTMSSIVIASGASTDMYEMQLVFPSIAPERAIGSRYFCNISFTVDNNQKSFTDLPIHDKMSQDIQALARNQYLQIETRINKGNDISFNFEVIDWTRKQEEIIFH